MRARELIKVPAKDQEAFDQAVRQGYLVVSARARASIAPLMEAYEAYCTLERWVMIVVRRNRKTAHVEVNLSPLNMQFEGGMRPDTFGKLLHEFGTKKPESALHGYHDVLFYNDMPADTVEELVARIRQVLRWDAVLEADNQFGAKHIA